MWNIISQDYKSRFSFNFASDNYSLTVAEAYCIIDITDKEEGIFINRALKDTDKITNNHFN